jgi:parallel beta-helix repeat protein
MTLIQKGQVILIVLLFIVTCIIPTTAQDVGNASQTMSKGQWLYVGGSGPNNYTKIQDAINDASVGDTVFVYDDSSPYNEMILINKSITLQGENKYTTIIDNQSYNLSYGIKIIADNVTVTGFTIQNTAGIGISNYFAGHIIDTTVSHNTVKDNIIKNTGVGVDISYPYKPMFKKFGYNTIANNHIENTTYWAIRIYAGSNNHIVGNTIVNNNVYNNDSSAIIIMGENNNISYNKVTNNSGAGILLTEAFKTMVYRNTFEKNKVGLVTGGSFNKILQNNFIDNEKNAYFDQAFFVTIVNAIFNFHLILPSIWNGNYWNEPRQLPYVVPGYLSLAHLHKYYVLGTDGFPFVRIDWHPAQEPYDIG